MRYISVRSHITWTAEQTRDIPTGSPMRLGPSPPRARLTSPSRIWNQDDAEYGQVRTKAVRWEMVHYSLFRRCFEMSLSACLGIKLFNFRRTLMVNSSGG